MGLFQKKVSILYNIELGPVYYRLGLAFPELARVVKPGQFVMIRPSHASIPLLRRPFSVHRLVVEEDKTLGIELLYKVVGQGTKAMSEMKAGADMDVLGPLGNGFPCLEQANCVFLVAGGVGVAALYYLAFHLSKYQGVTQTVFLGGSSSSDILCEKEFQSLGIKIHVSTEDASVGEAGLVTSAVETSLEAGERPDIIYACGPQAMMKAVGVIAGAYDIPCQVSLEAEMACGFGVCLGCAVKRAADEGGYFHVCIDGPVFDFRKVKI